MAKASYRVADLIKNGMPNATCCALMFEGYEIDYAHAKIIPILGDHTVQCTHQDYCDTYKGYITSARGPECDQEVLENLCKKFSAK